MTNKTKMAMVLTIVLWASAFVGIRVGLQGYSPAGLALLRYMIASVCMGIIYYRMPVRNAIKLRDACALMGIGAIGIGVYNIALNYGELVVSSGMASFIISQSPILTAVFALLFLGESLNLARVLGFVVSLAGVALMAVSQRDGFSVSVGMWYVFLAMFAGSCYVILQRPYLKKYHALEATTYVIWGGTLFLSFYLPELRQDLTHASLKTTLWVIYLGIFPAAIGYAAWSYVLNEIPMTRAASALYCMPFVATLMGWLLLDEVPMLLSLAGGILAIAGIFLVNKSYAR